MIKNKKGYSLIEVMVVVVIVAILGSIAFPYYLSTVEKTRVTTHVPELKSLLDMVVQYHASEEIFPAKLKSLPVTLNDWTYSGKTAAKSPCTVTLQDASAPYNINMVCKRGTADDWKLQFDMVINPSGNLMPSGKYFIILASADDRKKTLAKAAVSAGWTQTATTNTYKI